ncbi:hypothetical protein SDC9_96291 [bioreactor metagenome]|uniref:Uncharacterized protein n=1 Tax=bioreactor metagenome TaxID=1076179 RepID=A0A645AB91_9ZZZZ
MKNRVFLAQPESVNRRKLDVTLRQLTGDRLTAEQRDRIGRGLDARRQYAFQVCRCPGAFCREVNPKNARDGQTIIRTLFGDLEHLSKRPAAVLVRRLAPGERSNTVYIYLPTKKEETHHVHREREAAEP